MALLDTPDGTQSVYGFLPGPADAPTVLLYAHYDVQPPLDESAWLTPPFELTERDGRWYGRGAADCKGGFIMHLLALRALKANGGVPVNVKVIVEGSEEQGTGRPGAVRRGAPRSARRPTRSSSATPGNFRVGLPTVTSTLRGMTMLRVQVDTLEGNLHSGQFGGAAPDALAALIRVLDSLRAEDGSTTVDGLPADAAWDGLQYPEDAVPPGRQGARRCGADRLRHGRRPDLGASGRHRPRHRLPAGRRRHPVRAGERAGARSACGCRRAWTRPRRPSCCTPTCETHAPVGRAGLVEQIGQGQPFRADTTSPAYAAMAEAMRIAYPGQEMQSAGQGGSIPLCNTLASLYPRGGDPADRPERAGGADPRGQRERLPARNWSGCRSLRRSSSSTMRGPGKSENLSSPVRTRCEHAEQERCPRGCAGCGPPRVLRASDGGHPTGTPSSKLNTADCLRAHNAQRSRSYRSGGSRPAASVLTDEAPAAEFRYGQPQSAGIRAPSAGLRRTAAAARRSREAAAAPSRPPAAAVL